MCVSSAFVSVRWRRSLEREEPGFDVETGGESGQRAGGPDDSMTRRHDRQRVSAVRGADGARGAWMPDLLRDLRVRPRLAERDRQQCIPHLALKRRSRHIELQGESLPPAREVLGELTLRFDEHRMPCILGLEVHAHAKRPIVFPQDRREPIVGRHECERPHRGAHVFVNVTFAGVLHATRIPAARRVCSPFSDMFIRQV